MSEPTTEMDTVLKETRNDLVFGEGRVEDRIDVLLEVLEARGIRVDARSRQRIQRCTNLAQLKPPAWCGTAGGATR